MWLAYVVDHVHVKCLKCSVCIKYKEKLEKTCNYNSAYINGSENLRISSFKDHASSYTYQRRMVFLEERNSCITNYAPIAKALSNLDDATIEMLKKKCDIAYVTLKENLTFTKMKAMCELEIRHDVNLERGYLAIITSGGI